MLATYTLSSIPSVLHSSTTIFRTSVVQHSILQYIQLYNLLTSNPKKEPPTPKTLSDGAVIYTTMTAPENTKKIGNSTHNKTFSPFVNPMTTVANY